MFPTNFKSLTPFEAKYGNILSWHLQNISCTFNAKLDYLARLPEQLKMKIISYLALEDISKLSQVNKEFS